MKNEQKLNINEAANLYIQSGKEEVFTDLYERARSYYSDKLNYWSTHTTFASEHEIIGIFHDALWDAVEEIKRSGGNFFALFTVKLHGMYKSLLRKVVTKRKYEQYEYSKGDTSNTAMFETLADEFDLEEHVTKKKEADQRMLIDFLTDPDKVIDETTTVIVESFLSYDGKPPTPTAIGKKLGLHHMIVKRKIEKLAGYFDSKQFGDYQDYLLA